MKRTWSMSTARRRLGALIRSAERGRAITLTRYGVPVAVIAPLERTLEDAYAAFRRRHPRGYAITDEEVDSWRQRDSGRSL